MAKRRSPDSVVCIDLTEDDDDRKQNLEDVRKRHKGTPSAAAASKVKTEGIIEIDSDSDDGGGKIGSCAALEKQARLEKQQKAKGTSHKEVTSAAAAAASTIIKTEDRSAPINSDEDDGGGKIGSCAALEQQARLEKLQETQEISEVEILPRIAPVIHPVAASIADDEEIELVGTTNETRLPHARQYCPDNKFIPGVEYKKYHGTLEFSHIIPEAEKWNPKYCDLCYCYVCDKPAKGCTSWTAGSFSFRHCHATDTDSWHTLRVAKGANNIPVSTPGPFPSNVHHTSKSGPFAPDDQVASRDSSLTKCRKCNWYNRFDHKNFACLQQDVKQAQFSNKPDLHPTGFLDWCHSCGRVASEKDFGKVQAKPYVRRPGDVFLGEKVLPFRVVAHDPRKMDKFKDKWSTNEGSDPKWNYSAAEMEEDVFCHRFGKYPSIEMILASIPVVSHEKIPETGSFHMKTKQHGWYSDSDSYDSENDYYGLFGSYNGNKDYYGVGFESNMVSADETNAIILEKRNDRALLEELRNFESIGFENLSGIVPLAGEIVANWDRDARSGVGALFQVVYSVVFHRDDLILICFALL